MDGVTVKSALNLFKEEPRKNIHSFHRYFGKLIPGIPAFAIETFTQPGDVVLDPFSGSGTMVVEARERGRKGIGCDLNPLAIFVSQIKTTYLEEKSLQDALAGIIQEMEDKWEASAFEDPYVVNLDHWFRPEVKQKLHQLKFSISQIEEEEIRNFFLGVFSAFIRSVSNADPQHVFPGYSKRMRALDEAGRQINVEASFIRAAKKRIKQVSELVETGPAPKLLLGDLRSHKLRKNSVDLVVTNPPYISSIRYLETMKIEMGWLGFLHSQKEYLDLDKSVIGTERFYKKDLLHIDKTGYPEIDSQVEALSKSNLKMAKTVAQYFIEMDGIFSELSRLIKSGGHLVIKISDSRVRTEVISTHKHFISICEKYGFELLHDIIDEFDPNSRSLLTARNSYSGIMTFDHVLIMKANQPNEF